MPEQKEADDRAAYDQFVVDQQATRAQQQLDGMRQESLLRPDEIEAKERAQAATEGPFELPVYGNGTVAVVSRKSGLARNVVADYVLLADAEFFSRAKADIPLLLERLEEARAEVERLRIGQKAWASSTATEQGLRGEE
jgi:hypothetical protein